MIARKHLLRHGAIEALGQRAAGRGPVSAALDPTRHDARRLPAQRNRLRRAALVLLLLPAVGCSATSSVRHDPAQFAPIDSAVQVDTDFDLLWERLKTKPLPPGFTLVEIDEARGLLRLSLTTDRPEAYVDCGRTQRTFEGALGGMETFDYQPAARESYKLSNYQGEPLEATRDTVLDATAVVQTTPNGSATAISVDVSYVLRAMVTYSKLGAFGSPTGELDSVTREIRFQTGKPGIGDEEVAVCLANGKLERELLDWAT